MFYVGLSDVRLMSHSKGKHLDIMQNVFKAISTFYIV